MAAAASSRWAASEGVPWSELPGEVMECILSFLSVPTLCRLRTVCKGWNDLLCGASFHDLYENRRSREVIFLTRFKVADDYTRIDPSVQGVTCFLDLEERRWYSIRGATMELGAETRAVAMDEGLVAEFWSEDETQAYDDNYFPIGCGIEMSDPFSKLAWSLVPPFSEYPSNDDLPLLVVAADRVSRSFRLFLVDNSCRVRNLGFKPFMWFCDSDLEAWTYAKHPPNLKWEAAGGRNPLPRAPPEMNMITRARSAVCFRGDLYAIVSPFASDVCFLMKHNCEMNIWTMVREDVPEQSAHPQLLVSSGRLFMWFWRRSCRDAVMLEMEEIETPENSSRTVFQIPSAPLEHFFGDPMEDLACVVPRFNSDGSSCSSVVLVSGSSGRVIIYNVVSESADILPAHPLGGVNLRKQSNHRRYPRMRYWATLKNLSCRDILPSRTSSRPPVFMPGSEVKWIGP